MPNVTPDDLLRRIRALEERVGVDYDHPEPTDTPSYRGKARDAQLLIFQGPPDLEAPTPGRWRPVSMSGDATIDDRGVITVTGGGGFPVFYDDGTYSYRIRVLSGVLDIQAWLDSDPYLGGEPTLASIIEIDASEGDINIVSKNASTSLGDINLGANHEVNIDADNGDINIGVSGGGPVNIAAGGGAVGFFANAAVAQQATPATLGDVIALLQAYGLSA